MTNPLPRSERRRIKAREAKEIKRMAKNQFVFSGPTRAIRRADLRHIHKQVKPLSYIENVKRKKYRELRRRREWPVLEMHYQTRKGWVDSQKAKV